MGDRECHRIAVRCRAYSLSPLWISILQERVVRQIRSQLFCYAYRADSRAAATVRDCKSLVKVQVTNICTDNARVCKTHLGIHICPVHIDQTSVFVDNIHNLADALFKHTVGRGISDHQAGEPLFVKHSLFAKLANIDVSHLVARHQHYLHSGHCCRCRVGTVCRCGDNGNSSLGISFGNVVGTDGHKPGILTCSTRVGLNRAGVKSCNCCKILLGLLNKFHITLNLS